MANRQYSGDAQTHLGIVFESPSLTKSAARKEEGRKEGRKEGGEGREGRKKGQLSFDDFEDAR